MSKKTILIIILILTVFLAILVGYLYSNSVSFEKFTINNFLKFITDDKISMLQEQIQIEYDNNEKTKFIIVNNLLYKVSRSGTEIITKNGDLKGVLNITPEEPVVAKVDKRIFIGDRKSQKVFLVEGTEIINEIEFPGFLYNITFNNDGFGVITGMDKEEISYAFVIDRDGNIIFKRFLTELYAMEGIVSQDNMNVILNCIDTSGLEGKTYIYILDIKGDEIGGVWPKKDGIYPLLNFIDSSTFYICGQKEMYIYKDRDIIKEYKFNEIINGKMITDNQVAILIKIEDNKSQLIVFEKNGDYRELITFNESAKNLYSYSGIIGVNTGNEAIYYNSKGQELGRIGSINIIEEILFFNKLETVIITKRSYIIDRIVKENY